MKWVLMLLAILAASALAPASAQHGGPSHYGRTWWVDDDNCPGPGSGTRHDPFCRIQDAVDAASTFDTIIVLGGTYNENLLIADKPLFLMADLGGERPTINGGQAGPVITLDHSDSSLDGFVITGGYTSYGGGIYSTQSSPIIVDNIVENNTATRCGGGIYTEGGGGVIEGNIIRRNLAVSRSTTPRGGGLLVVNSPGVRLARNQIFANRVASNGTHAAYGGGVGIQGGSVLLENNLIVNNQAVAANPQRGYGGGLDLGGMAVANPRTAVNLCTIAFNRASGRGGAINVGLVPLYVSNSILYFDKSPSYPEINDPGNTSTVDYSDIAGGWTGAGTGNIDIDPRFASLGVSGFHLQGSSPCVDTGDPAFAAFFDSASDMDFNPRILDGDLNGTFLVDMGCYEFNNAQLSVAGTFKPDGQITIKTSGKTGMPSIMIVGFGKTVFPRPPYGCLFVNIDLAAAVYPFGLIPQSQTLKLPASLPAPYDLYWQVFALWSAAAAGNFSNLIGVHVTE